MLTGRNTDFHSPIFFIEMDPRSPRAKQIAIQNIQHIDKLIELIKKQIPKPPEKPKEVNDFYRVKEVD